MITFTFNNVELTAFEGESLAAALLKHNEKITRFTRIGNKPRGIFCGIGICFDCLIVINGQPNQRSCVTEVKQGMVVTVQDGD